MQSQQSLLTVYFVFCNLPFSLLLFRSTPHPCKTACNPVDHKPLSVPEVGQNYLAGGGSGALAGAAAGAAAPAQLLQGAAAQLLQAGAPQLGAQLLQAGAPQLGAQLFQAGAAQEGCALLHLDFCALQHLACLHFGALHPRAADASPATRTSANMAPNTNIILRTIANSSIGLGTSCELWSGSEAA